MDGETRDRRRHLAGAAMTERHVAQSVELFLHDRNIGVMRARNKRSADWSRNR